MIITKTEQFNRRFLYDLAELVIFKREYLDEISRWEREGRLLDIGYGRQPSRKVKFLGSYFEKKVGSMVTDIDVNVLVEQHDLKNPKFYLRLNSVLATLDRTPFRFVSFTCGYVKGLSPPWSITEQGQCQFSITKVEHWLRSVKSEYPAIYNLVKPYLDKPTISMVDVIKADQAIEPVISLTWTKQEIINGYKDYNGTRYNFMDTLYTYTGYRIMNLLYNYRGDYCMVEFLFIVKTDRGRPTTDSASYYIDNVYKKIKYLKRYLRPDMISAFTEERKQEVGKLSALSTFIQLLTTLKTNQMVAPSKLKEMENYARQYASEHNINTIDYAELQILIEKRVSPLYRKYREFIKPEARLELFTFDILAVQANEQVSRQVLLERERSGTSCPLFPMSVKQIEWLYRKAEDVLIDPYRLYRCIADAANESVYSLSVVVDRVFTDKPYKIRKEDGEVYRLSLNNKVVAVSQVLEYLQRVALTDKIEN